MGDDGCGGVAGCFDMISLTSKPETALNSTHLDSRWDNFPIRVPKVLRQHKMKHDKTYFIYIYCIYIYIHVYPRHCIIQANNLDHIYDSSVRFER